MNRAQTDNILGIGLSGTWGQVEFVVGLSKVGLGANEGEKNPRTFTWNTASKVSLPHPLHI